MSQSVTIDGVALSLAEEEGGEGGFEGCVLDGAAIFSSFLNISFLLCS